MKRKTIKKMFVIVLAATLFSIFFALPAHADNGDIYVEIVVKSFDGSQGMAGLEVTYFNKMMVTSRRGTVKYELLGLADNETEFFSVYDSSQVYYGGATTNLILSPDTGVQIRPAGNPGVFDMDIHYTQNTDGITINTVLTQAGDLEITSVDFDERKGSAPPEEPQFEEPHPEDPDIGHLEEPHPEDPDMGNHEPEKQLIFGMNYLTAGLIAAVIVLLIVVIILLAVNAGRQKEKNKN